MCGGHGDAVTREPQRRLDEAPPGQPAVRLPQRAEARGDAGHGARRGPDGVVDELLAEGHLEVDELGPLPLDPEARDRAEAVEVADGAGRRLVVNRMPAAEEARHHRLGHAAREAGGDRGVGGAPAVVEDLRAGGGGRGMAGRDGGDHRTSTVHPTRATPGRGKSTRWLISVASRSTG